MRQLIIDTETTGLDPKHGPPHHRVRRRSSSSTAGPRAATLHFHVDPEREIDAGATEVHGMTWDDLKGRPRFRDVAAEIRRLRARRRVDHPQRAVRRRVPRRRVRARRPARAARPCYGGADRHAGAGARGVSRQAQQPRCAVRALRRVNAHRTLHGALLDAQLLAEVYLAMTRGQESLTIDMGAAGARASVADARRRTRRATAGRRCS